MASEEANVGVGASEARDLLAAARTHGRRARADVRGEWFPLLLFGFLTLLGAPLYAQQLFNGFPWADLYWIVAGSAGYVAVARFYRRREAERGIGSSLAPYVWVGLGLFFFTFGLVSPILSLIPHVGAPAYAAAVRFLPRFANGIWLIPGFAPIVAIGVGMLPLAWVERRPSLAVFGVSFSVVATLCGIYFFDNRLHLAAWYQSILDVAVLGSILLAAGIVFRIMDLRAARARSSA
jgi:hypothetical protein